MSKQCECGNPAAYTFYTDKNTMWWFCAECADEIKDDATVTTEEYQGCIMVVGIEETSTEKKERLEKKNLLRFKGLKLVS